MELVLIVLVLGLIEGLTEFLPISSTGHLIIAADLLGYTGARADTFKIVIQLGAILAVCWHYRRKLGAILRGLGREPGANALTLNLLLAFLPAAFLGLIFREEIKTVLFDPMVVAVSLVLGGIVMLVIEARAPAAHIHALEDVGRYQALKIGCAQALALVPGVSRSGATIMGARVFGLSHRAATEFSFFLAIPTMFAATTYDLYKSMHLLLAEDILLFSVGFLAAFASGLLAVRLFLRYVGNHGFVAFAWYRILFGLVCAVYFSTFDVAPLD
ncbi:MAG TPA: undecaprenyl-diphosphatase [Gammaproteobacteria bacterium]|nr:undecaprenyl-diphosphatase [Gammaproteobacteria bacterium]